MADHVKSHDPVAGTTWAFLQSGWWILHVIAIVAVFWLGHVLWPERLAPGPLFVFT